MMNLSIPDHPAYTRQIPNPANGYGQIASEKVSTSVYGHDVEVQTGCALTHRSPISRRAGEDHHFRPDDFLIVGQWARHTIPRHPQGTQPTRSSSSFLRERPAILRLPSRP